MPLIQKIAAVRSNLARFQSLYDEACTRRPRLQALPDPEAVVSALDAASTLPAAERYAILGALVGEHAQRSHPLWASLLLVAFAPLLLRMRTRLGHPEDDERDQRVLLAFLQAIGRVAPDTSYVAAAIQLETRKALAAARKKEKADREHVSFDEDAHSPYSTHAIQLAELRAEMAWAARRAERALAERRSRHVGTVHGLPVRRRPAA
jgi:hypothetical protein